MTEPTTKPDPEPTNADVQMERNGPNGGQTGARARTGDHGAQAGLNERLQGGSGPANGPEELPEARE